MLGTAAPSISHGGLWEHALTPAVHLESVGSFNVETGWPDEDNVADKVPAPVSSVGLVMDEYDSYFLSTLALSMHMVGENGHRGSGVTIPKRSVTPRGTLTSSPVG